jgi:hypothetical protein
MATMASFLAVNNNLALVPSPPSPMDVATLHSNNLLPKDPEQSPPLDEGLHKAALPATMAAANDSDGGLREQQQNGINGNMSMANTNETGSTGSPRPSTAISTSPGTRTLQTHSHADGSSAHSDEHTHESDGEQDGSENGTIEAGGDSAPPSKKKKGQRFFCTDFPPCNLSFTRSEHLARHIRYAQIEQRGKKGCD